MKEQIEEMAKAMCGNGMSNGNCVMDDEPCNLECVYGCCAEKLYAKGYRKQSEGEWKKVYQNKVAYVYECTNCGHLTFGTSDYCICGAKMKGGAT